VQEKHEDGDSQYTKVIGTDNPADLMTKHVPYAILEKMTNILGQRFKEGRAEHSLRL
jgi:hypothetical protein